MEQSRVILAVVLSMVVFFVYYTFIAPPPQNKPQQVQTQSVPSDENENALADSAKPKLTKTEVTSSLEDLPVSDNNREPSYVHFENQQIEGALSDEGGSIAHLRLKNFKASANDKAGLIDLLGDDESTGGLSFTLDYTKHDQGAIYDILDSKQTDEGEMITLQWKSKNLEVRKVILIGTQKSNNEVEINVEVINHGNNDIMIEPRLWVSRLQKEKKSSGFLSSLRGPPDLWFPMTYADGSLETDHKWNEMPSKVSQAGRVYWAGLSDRYFLMGLIARQDTDVTSIHGRKGEKVFASLSYGHKLLRGNESLKSKFVVYFGPKKRSQLADIGNHLEASLDYGWFGWIAAPLLWLLIFFQKFVFNWGVAVIVLTFFVKLCLYPVNKKAMLSMKAMQKLQPRLKEIREKYKDDKERLNQEMMGLFRTHKVNPMGGCLPMILQMPVYIGLYKVLWNAVELYQAPFFWIYQDLSAPDPIFVTPVLLGIMMMLQQKLNPQSATMDPTQQKVMMIMPLMFGAFMAFFPFGLVLYILVNTTMSVIQQYMIHEEITLMDLLKGRFKKQEA